MSLINLLTVLYAFVGIVGVVGFIPVIKDVYFHKKKKASVLTFLLWSLTSFISFNYGVFVVSDKMFIAISAVNFAFCFSILLMLLFMELEGEREINKIRNRFLGTKKLQINLVQNPFRR